MSAGVRGTADASSTPASRERMAAKGVTYAGHLVDAHVAGQRRADLFIACLLQSSTRGDELLNVLIDLAERVRSHEGRAHARGFARGLQKRLEATAL